LLLHDGTPESSDLFQSVLTMLDPQVRLTLVPVVPAGREPLNGHGLVKQDEERARQLGRALAVEQVNGDVAVAVVKLAREGEHDLIIVPLPPDLPARPNHPLDARSAYILGHAHCPVFLAGAPIIPHEVVDTHQPPA
jgi:hypothetical protein